jgi:hypothetical protein
MGGAGWGNAGSCSLLGQLLPPPPTSCLSTHTHASWFYRALLYHSPKYTKHLAVGGCIALEDVEHVCQLDVGARSPRR